MNDHPYIVSKYSQSEYRIIDIDTGERILTCSTEDIALTVIDAMKIAFKGGANYLANKLLDVIDGSEGESDSTLSSSGASKHAKRVAQDRRRAEGGAA